jgi:hypothetical protein
MFNERLEAIRRTFSGRAAKNYVIDIARFHRLQASPGFRQAANYCVDRLREAGLDAELLSFPANDETQFWSAPAFQEWDVEEATLHLIEPEKERRKLADFRDQPLSVIQRSAPFEGEAEVVLLEDGEEAGDYEGLDLEGKIVLTKGNHRRVQELAVKRRGAVGIISDADEFLSVRPRLAVPDALQYTCFRWTGEEEKCFGFVLSPREGEKLRKLIKKQAKKGEPPVKVRAKVDSTFSDGAIEVVSALIPGGTKEEVVVIGHLCHFRPGANDNASGPATVIELARTLRMLIDARELDPPKRGIRFLCPPEMTGTYAYLATHEDKIDDMIAGVNLDMVGQNQELCGSTFLVERTPQALPSFAPSVMLHLREAFVNDRSPLGGTGTYASFRHAVIPFSGGSDHWILCDPSVGVPTLQLLQWPDKYYHTSADTPDKVDPAMLDRIGGLAAAYAYFIASAGPDEAGWLGHEMTSRFKRELLELVQGQITKAVSVRAEEGEEGAEKLSKLLAALEKKVAFLSDRERVALSSLEQLSPQIDVAGWQEEVREFAGEQAAAGARAIKDWARSQGWSELPTASQRELDEWEQKAATLVPRRTYRGPVYSRPHLKRLSDEERDEYWQVRQTVFRGSYGLVLLAEYWADGERTLLDIADLIELETGQRNVELLVRYFQTLAKVDLMELETSG